MNLQHLYYFQKIAECQQYTTAAEELHVTQAALSYAVSNLESELKVKLFERKGRSVVLTPYGKIYLACVRDAFQDLERGERAIKDMLDPSAVTIRMVYTESLKSLIPKLISDFRRSDSTTRFKFDLAHYPAPTVEQYVIRREAELGISYTPASMELSFHPIGYQEDVVVVSPRHPWAVMDYVTLDMLESQPYITYSRDCSIRRYYDSVLESANVRPTIFAEARFDSTILDMVAYDLGVAIVPRMKLLDQSHLKVIPIRDKIPARPICLLWAKNGVLPPQVDYFRRCIIESADLSSSL